VHVRMFGGGPECESVRYVHVKMLGGHLNVRGELRACENVGGGGT
jgi:hypothetical protein